MIKVGDIVIYQGENWGHLVSVIGKVVEDHGNTVVIQDRDAETVDDRLEFKKSEVKLLEDEKNEPAPFQDARDHHLVRQNFKKMTGGQ